MTNRTSSFKSVKPVHCIACGETKAPAKDDYRSQFCQRCYEEIKADMSLPVPAPVGVPAGFRRNDGRLF